MVPFEVMHRYWLLLENVEPNCEEEPGTSLPHIKWMLGTMQAFTDVEKQMRWLGFIQGVLIMNGLTTVTEERNFTRPFFKKVT